MNKKNNFEISSFIQHILPDNRPITAFQIVEDSEKCPRNFNAISRTYDQDADADLWRENVLFGKKNTRYLCLSKTEGLPYYVVETLKVVGDKERLPEGYSLLTRTADSDQRAWRKKQLIYRLVKTSSAKQVITDVILCSRSKKAPEGFLLAGEINGILICYKINASTPCRTPPAPPSAVSSPAPPVPHRAPPERPPKPQDLLSMMGDVNIKSPIKLQSDSGHDYEQLRTSYNIPLRPAPTPPVPPKKIAVLSPQYSSATLGGYCGLEGVPFVLSSKLKGGANTGTSVPLFKGAILTADLDYNFSLERQVLNATK